MLCCVVVLLLCVLLLLFLCVCCVCVVLSFVCSNRGPARSASARICSSLRIRLQNLCNGSKHTHSVTIQYHKNTTTHTSQHKGSTEGGGRKRGRPRQQDGETLMEWHNMFLCCISACFSPLLSSPLLLFILPGLLSPSIHVEWSNGTATHL